MKEGSTYPTNQAIAVLLLGESGTGKSNFCFDWPDPGIADCEGNLRNAIERHPGKRFWFATPERDAKDQPLEPHAKWDRMVEIVEEMGKAPHVKTLVVDGLGTITDYLKAHLIHKGSQMEKQIQVGGITVMSKSLWEPFEQKLKRLVIQCRSYGKPFVMTAHLKIDENEMTAVKEQRVNLQGKLQNDFQKLFTDCYQTLTALVPVDKTLYPTGVKYTVRTAPTIRLPSLKCSAGLPPEFETRGAEWQALMQKIGGASS